jgi:mevalonate kinase
MNRRTASGRGAAKVILLGEHAVVHGSTALALSLECGITARAERTSNPFELTAPAWHLTVRAKDGSTSEKALVALADALDLKLDNVHLDIDPDVPPRSGLGASAAVATAAARALLGLHEKTVSQDTLFRAVHASETVFHGNPSGIDARLSMGEGLMAFSKKDGVTPVSAALPRLLVAHSGTPGDTRATLERFAAKMLSSPDEAARRLTEIDRLVKQGISALEQEETAIFGEIMVQNHEALRWFGVSSQGLDDIVRIALDAGALGAKMTGGGGGGCAVVLPGRAEEAVRRHLRSAGFGLILG